ncbi:MAG TPA: hypothetical protein VLD58_15715 [Gemmatimonadales bacterium]|nr:hypothetical protein [Gemmatimonadales bacterium]
MSKQQMSRLVAAMALAAMAAGCGNSTGTDGTGSGGRIRAQVVTATGDLTTSLTQFRGLLGDPANTTPGEQPTGRREINWDGVGAALLNVNNFPGDQFNRVVPRGQIFTTPGTGFRVSDNALFDLEPSDSTQFSAFSPIKTFVPIGSPIVDVKFRVAGSDTPAVVTGFGVVFSDVDRNTSASIEYFRPDGRTLGKIFAPVRSDARGHSFAGVVFDTAVVARVRIVAGDASVAAGRKDVSAGGTDDLVDTDDFIAGEPHPIP